MSEENPTIKSLVKAGLELLGFDGLFSSEIDCGCDLEDLMPCDEPCPSCEAGYKTKTPPGEVEIDGGCHREYDEYDWYICRRKHD